MLHTLNHAVFKSLLFLGAGAFERAVGSLELDRLGGLLRRMPWTGGAFLVGSLAIAGVPPLNGFASEWLTLQALVHVPAYGGLGDGLAGALALAALAATAALAVFCFVKVVGLVLLGPPRRAPSPTQPKLPFPMRAAVVALAGACVALGVVPGLLVAPLAAPGAVAGVDARRRLPCICPAPDRCRRSVSRSCSALLVPLFFLLRGRRVAAPAPTWVCGQLVQPQLAWTSAGFTKPLRLVLEAVLRPQREIAVRTSGGVVQEVSYSGRVPHLIDERLYAPIVRSALVARPPRATPADRPPRHVRRVPDRARARAARRGEGRRHRMSASSLVSATVELVGGLLLAPLLPGLVQHWKARLQGRRGPSPLQPYRELRRLWGKSAVDPAGSGVVYRWAPAVVASSVAAAVLLVPVAGRAPGSASAATCSSSPACSRSRASPSPPRRGTSRTASR